MKNETANILKRKSGIQETKMPSNEIRRDIKTRFKPGHKRNEKFSEPYVLDVLQKMYQILVTVADANMLVYNPVRANNIKLQKELCLATGISTRRFEYFKEKFTKERARHKITGQIQLNPYFSDPIRDIVEKIQDICECRLIYSGTKMDMILLQKHYSYSFQRNNESPCKVKFFRQAPDISIINL